MVKGKVLLFFIYFIFWILSPLDRLVFADSIAPSLSAADLAQIALHRCQPQKAFALAQKIADPALRNRFEWVIALLTSEPWRIKNLPQDQEINPATHEKWPAEEERWPDEQDHERITPTVCEVFPFANDPKRQQRLAEFAREHNAQEQTDLAAIDSTLAYLSQYLRSKSNPTTEQKPHPLQIVRQNWKTYQFQLSGFQLQPETKKTTFTKTIALPFLFSKNQEAK